MRRILAAAAVLLLAAPAAATPVRGAHVPAKIIVVEPAEGAVVDAGRVRVVLTGEGGLAPAAFRLLLDGRTVDATGRIGGVFSTLHVGPAERLVVDVPVEPGEHTLVAEPNADPDSQQQPAVRRFTAVEGEGGGAVPAAALAGVALVAALGTAVAVRRRAAAAGREEPDTEPDTEGTA